MITGFDGRNSAIPTAHPIFANEFQCKKFVDCRSNDIVTKAFEIFGS